MKTLRGANACSKYGDSDTISDEFARSLVSKYIKSAEEDEASVSVGEMKEFLFTSEEQGAIEDTVLSYMLRYKYDIPKNKADMIVADYRREFPYLNKQSKRVASKDELFDLGLVSIGTGLYKDAKHHLWKLRRDSDGYVIEREADEEEFISARSRIASKKVAKEVIVEGATPTDVRVVLNEVDDEGVSLSYEFITSTEARVTLADDSDYEILKERVTEAGLEIKEASKKEAEIETSKKVFSDETIVKGIDHYMNMGFSAKEAINVFLESHGLEKSEYEVPIKNVLAKYKFIRDAKSNTKKVAYSDEFDKYLTGEDTPSLTEIYFTESLSPDQIDKAIEIDEGRDILYETQEMDESNIEKALAWKEDLEKLVEFQASRITLDQLKEVANIDPDLVGFVFHIAKLSDLPDEIILYAMSLAKEDPDVVHSIGYEIYDGYLGKFDGDRIAMYIKAGVPINYFEHFILGLPDDEAEQLVKVIPEAIRYIDTDNF